eukprot:TRINITY_DN7324_c0_g2_i2.p1 TRINITY_DN7324_c0_g2~~TRINITY_DN7324_c0_g2_i2.p1  ORF type:complete len:266 (-),score=21.86 TRINITY_DN7324_c0_g2_i2:123-920(-)
MLCDPYCVVCGEEGAEGHVGSPDCYLTPEWLSALKRYQLTFREGPVCQPFSSWLQLKIQNDFSVFTDIHRTGKSSDISNSEISSSAIPVEVIKWIGRFIEDGRDVIGLARTCKRSYRALMNWEAWNDFFARIVPTPLGRFVHTGGYRYILRQYEEYLRRRDSGLGALPGEATPEQAWEAAMRAVGEECPRYVICNVEYKSREGMRRLLCMVLYCPYVAPMRWQMLYSGQGDTLRKCLPGIQMQLHIRRKMNYGEVSQMVQEKMSK